MSYLKEAFREAARREFVNVPPESELSYVFSTDSPKRVLTLLNNENHNEPKSCFFIGHHDAPTSIQDKLFHTIKQCIVELGISHFVVGHYGNFDQITISALKAIKQETPSISLQLLLPYHPAEHPVELPEGFDASFYPEGQEAVPKKLAIITANQSAIRQSNLIIAFVNGPGNAQNLLSYAKKHKIQVINLAEN